jgi:FKBP12-rapamycin complex-associated protein
LDYGASLVRDRANQQAATELSSLLWILAHEMSLEDYGAVESEIFTSVFALVHEAENERRMAGLAALDALIDAPSADEEKKAIKFANTLSNGLRSAHGDYEFLSAVSKALGHMATRTANVDFVESEVTRALEWLRTERSDRRCVIIGLYCCLFHFLLLYCICLCLCRKQAFSLTHNPPCLFYGYI